MTDADMVLNGLEADVVVEHGKHHIRIRFIGRNDVFFLLGRDDCARLLGSLQRLYFDAWG